MRSERGDRFSHNYSFLHMMAIIGIKKGERNDGEKNSHYTYLDD